LQRNRKNFGLRDPIMPIHELVVEAPNQRFAQLLGVMLARVAKEYGAKWTTQAPDVSKWGIDPSVRPTTARPDRKHSTGQIESARRKASGRFSVAILMLHYARRIPLNDKCQAPHDFRRQASQFQICRLIVTLANVSGKNTHRDIDDVIELSLNAILHISVDARAATPRGKSESLWALAAAARVLKDAERDRQAEGAVEILAWCAVNTQQISGSRADSVIENLRQGGHALDELFAARVEHYRTARGDDHVPRVGKCDPWHDPASSSSSYAGVAHRRHGRSPLGWVTTRPRAKGD
jgi:hypothetical protein